MLSKMAKPEPNTTYREISKIDLSTLKLPDLKKCAKDLSIKVSGNKAEIKRGILSTDPVKSGSRKPNHR